METSAVAAQSEFSGEADSVSGVVRIGAPEGMATSMLAEVAVRLCEQHPKLELQIVAMPRTFSLTKREADIAIRHTQPVQADLIARRLGCIRGRIYAARRLLEEVGLPKSVEDLRDKDFIGIDDTG